MKKIKKGWAGVGVAVATVLIILAWFFGFFTVIFYILGLYTALYFVSIIFRTTKIIEWVLGAGAIIMYVVMIIGGLFILYLVLRYMFETNFLLGLVFLIFGLPILETLLYGLVMALGYPLVWFLEDLEKRFGEKTNEII